MILIWCSLNVVMTVQMDVTASSTTSLPCDLTTLVGNLFHHHPTYSDEFIERRMTKDYSIQLSSRQVKRIRLQQGWLRRDVSGSTIGQLIGGKHNSAVAFLGRGVSGSTIRFLLRLLWALLSKR